MQKFELLEILSKIADDADIILQVNNGDKTRICGVNAFRFDTVMDKGIKHDRLVLIQTNPPQTRRGI